MRRVALVILALVGGCTANNEFNTTCTWPEEESPRSLNLVDARDTRHLTDDALAAEDLAIRHADAHRGHRSKHFQGASEYRGTRDHCMASLFDTIAARHQVTSDQVRSALESRRAGVDAVVMISFAALYALMASGVVRGIQQSSIGSTRSTALPALVVIAFAFSFVGVMLGDLWVGLIEVMRIGNDHVSYRLNRVPWRHHRQELFVVGVLVFWSVAALRYRIPTTGEAV